MVKNGLVPKSVVHQENEDYKTEKRNFLSQQTEFAVMIGQVAASFGMSKVLHEEWDYQDERKQCQLDENTGEADKVIAEAENMLNMTQEEFTAHVLYIRKKMVRKALDQLLAGIFHLSELVTDMEILQANLVLRNIKTNESINVTITPEDILAKN